MKILFLTCDCTVDTRNILNGTRCVWLSWPFQKPEWLCCMRSSSPCYRTIWDSLSCIELDLLSCKVWNQLRLAWNDKKNVKNVLNRTLTRKNTFDVLSADRCRFLWSFTHLQSQHPHFKQSSCQKSSHAFKKNLSVIFLPQPAQAQSAAAAAGPLLVLFWFSDLISSVIFRILEIQIVNVKCQKMLKGQKGYELRAVDLEELWRKPWNKTFNLPVLISPNAVKYRPSHLLNEVPHLSDIYLTLRYLNYNNKQHSETILLYNR